MSKDTTDFTFKYKTTNDAKLIMLYIYIFFLSALVAVVDDDTKNGKKDE